MGRIIMMMNVTLDGCCDHTQAIADEELHRYTEELMDQSDGLLSGREVYQLMEGFWPTVASSGASGARLIRHSASSRSRLLDRSRGRKRSRSSPV